MFHLFKQQSLFNHSFLLESTVSIIKESLRNFADSPDLNDTIALAFGSNADINLLKTNWQTGNFIFPAIEIVSASTINGANGAFSRDTNTIYLSAEFLTLNQSNLDAVNAVLLEEYGHYLDSELNSLESVGDEGAIFAALVSGEELSEDRLQELQQEEDRATATIDGETIAIEQSLQLNPNPRGNTDGEYIYVDGLLTEESFITLFTPFVDSEGGVSVVNASGGTEFTYSFLNRSSASLDDFAFERKGGFARETFNWSTEENSERNEVEYALELISNVTNITFVPANDDDADADFKFVLTNAESSGWSKNSKAGRAYPPGHPASGFVYFNKDHSAWQAGIEQGNRIFSTLFHEIMHGLGLTHPHDGEIYPGVTNPRSYGDGGRNSGLYTAMSYNRDVLVPGTPAGFDVAALQYLYGVNPDFNSGANTYFLADRENFFETIWDTGVTFRIKWRKIFRFI